MDANKVKLAIREEVAKIKADSRYKAKPALVQINAPLALIQVEMKAQVAAYEKVLTMLAQVKS